MLGAAAAVFMGASLGTIIFSAFSSHKIQKASLKLQAQALQQQADELSRMRKREAEQQRRENEQLMNSVTNLTDTSYNGVSAPTLATDKYGDLG